MLKKIFENKVVSFIFSFLEWAIFLVLLVLVILTGIQRFSNQGNFFGYRIYTVASNSMIPIYSIGDTLLIKDVPASKIKVGDAVTYMGEASGLKGMIITHQVQKIEVIDGKIQFHTKGIANEIEDPIVYEDQVFGKVVHKFTFLSILGKITSSMTSMMFFLTIPIAILIAIELMKAIYHKDDEDEEDDDESDSSNTKEIEDSKVEMKDDLQLSLEEKIKDEDNDEKILEESNQLIDIGISVNQEDNEIDEENKE